MERAQIVQGLERCADGCDCERCCYAVRGRMLGECISFLEKDALALIRELIEENERLNKQNAYLVKEAVFSPMERAHNTIAVKAETVRDVMIELSAKIGTYQSDSTIRVADVFKMLSIIKKDILEGEDQ